jgi:hypothetical protein
MHASSGIRTHDLSVGASEDSSCLKSSGHCDQDIYEYIFDWIISMQLLPVLSRTDAVYSLQGNIFEPPVA